MAISNFFDVPDSSIETLPTSSLGTMSTLSFDELITPDAGFPRMLLTMVRRGSAGTEEAAVFITDGPGAVRQVGNSFGASTVEAPTSNNVHHPANCTIKFENKLYSWVRNVIREYDPGTNSWTTAYTVADQLSTNGYAYHTGLYFAILNGTPTIFGAYQTASNTAKVVKFDGTTWSAIGGIVSTAGHGYWGPAFLHKNRLWIPTSFNGVDRHLFLDPLNGAGQAFTSNSASESNTRTGGCYVNFRGRLFGIHVTNPTNRTWVLFEWAGGRWMQLQNLLVGINESTEHFYGAFAWASTDAIYVFISHTLVSNTNTFRLYKLTPTGTGLTIGETFTSTDISNPVLSAQMRSNLAYPTTAESRCRVSGFVDYRDPTSPRVFLWTLRQSLEVPGGPITLFEFTNDTTELTNHGFMTSTAVAVTHSNVAAGEYLWDSRAEVSKLNIIIESLSLIGGVYTIGFRIHGGDGLTGRVVRLYFATEEGQAMVACTLTAGTVTGGSATNTATQINSATDDGSVLHTVVWDATTQNVTPESSLVLVGSVE